MPWSTMLSKFAIRGNSERTVRNEGGGTQARGSPLCRYLYFGNAHCHDKCAHSLQWEVEWGKKDLNWETSIDQRGQTEETKWRKTVARGYD